MANVIDLIKTMIEHPDEIERVSKNEATARLDFKFRGNNFEISSYWSDAFENTIWTLSLATAEGDIYFSTADVDLNGYQNYFSTLYRVVDERRVNFPKILDLLLKNKK